jgi:hypothetical protein
MVRARRIVRKHFGRDHHPVYRALAKALAMTAWPPALLIHIWQIRLYWGPREVPMEKIPGALWAAIRHNVLPGEYYAYELWKPNRRVNIDSYLYSHEAPRLFKVLNRPSLPDPIDDKLAFHEMCTAHKLPTPAVLASFAETGKLQDFDEGRPPAQDLFVKPRCGFAGDGSERFRWYGDAFESNRGARIKPEDLSKYLLTRARSENRTLLVQPLLFNHPQLGVEPNAALATARLVTGLSKDGQVFPIFAFIYFARSQRITAQHGYVALVNVANGRLMSSPSQDFFNENRARDRLDVSHILPDWDKALQNAKAAHRTCSNFVFIGWDIAFTGQGPVLLEGNANWNADEYQSLTGEPLGRTKFTEVLADALVTNAKRSEPEPLV